MLSFLDARHSSPEASDKLTGTLSPRGLGHPNPPLTAVWRVLRTTREPQDFAQIRVASYISRQGLDFSAIPRGNRSWARNRGKLQLVGGLKTWN
jgi:hypothetical protein